MLTTVIIIAAVIISIILAYLLNVRTELIKYKTRISFKESMDLTKLPIITFSYDGAKLNFVLDTGSNISFISNRAYDSLGIKGTKCLTDVAGYNGVLNVDSMEINIDLRYKKRKYNTNLVVSPTLDAAFEELRKQNGVRLHGLIGTDFLEKYKYILDFDELVARIK